MNSIYRQKTVYCELSIQHAQHQEGKFKLLHRVSQIKFSVSADCGIYHTWQISEPRIYFISQRVTQM